MIIKFKKSILKLFLLACVSHQLIAAVPSLTISQVPLMIVATTRPQVLIAIANSESMDGNLSGAIMTGSGSLAATYGSLSSSSSPINYLVPAGFTPPLQGPDVSGNAPYTVNQTGVLYDNSASRLNVAKAGVQAILQSYMQTTDFALETYNLSSINTYTTWVYYMSPNRAGFSFVNVMQPLPNRYVNNPCYNYPAASATVNANCTAIAGYYGAAQPVQTSQYMQIGASSDDPNINDVLYAGAGYPGVFLTYAGPTPATPYPPNFTLTNYNNNGVSIGYANSQPNIGGFSTGPTNAGFVPYSQQVIYSRRGFGYYGSQSATTGKLLVNMTNLGNNPSAANVTAAINSFTPFMAPETNKSGTTEIKAAAGQSPMAGLLTTAQTYMSGLPAANNGCPPSKYVILISDGLPTQDLSGKAWPPLGSAAAVGYGVSATFNADGSLNTTNNVAVSDAITKLSAMNQAGIKTFVIGLGAGVDPTLNPQAASTLTAMAVAGGTIAYYPATNPAALVSALNSILLQVQSGSLTTTSASVSSTKLQAGPIAFQASFTATDTPYQDWTGNFVAKSLDPIAGAPVGSTVWSAQALLDTLVQGSGWLNNRLIATWNPTLVSGNGDAVPFVWTSLSATQKTQLQPSDSLGQSRLQYLRGNTALEIRNGGTFRNRSHILGDIVDSQPLYVGVPSGPYLYSPSYLTFINNQANRQPMIYVGANDGFLHAFSAATGAEKFAFIPNAVFNNLDNLTSTVYNVNHLFFVDGPPLAGDVQFSDGTWHTLLVGGENGGGNSIYAIDITTPSSITTETTLANNILWEFSDSDMGLSYSQPQIAPINPGSAALQRFAVFFGNGYNSPTNKAVLYALDPQTKTVIAKIDLCAKVPSACNAAIVQGLSTVAFGVNDGVQGQAINTVYAGDLQGNLWAVDVTSTNANQWSVRVLFQAKDALGAAQPITTQPVVSLHPLYPRTQGLFVMFGTGELLTVADLTNSQTQTVYGVWDKPAANTTFLRANLQSQTLTLVLAAVSGLPTDILLATVNSVSWVSKVGWYDDLVKPGQRIVSNPQLLNGAFLATLITPPLNICGGLFNSMFLELNYLTGGAFPQPQLDINGDLTINSSDQYQGKNPVGVGLSAGYASSPTLLGPNQNNNMVKLISQSGGQQTAILDPNNSPRVSSWWQIF